MQDPTPRQVHRGSRAGQGEVNYLGFRRGRRLEGGGAMTELPPSESMAVAFRNYAASTFEDLAVLSGKSLFSSCSLVYSPAVSVIPLNPPLDIERLSTQPG